MRKYGRLMETKSLGDNVIEVAYEKLRRQQKQLRWTLDVTEMTPKEEIKNGDLAMIGRTDDVFDILFGQELKDGLFFGDMYLETNLQNATRNTVGEISFKQGANLFDVQGQESFVNDRHVYATGVIDSKKGTIELINPWDTKQKRTFCIRDLLPYIERFSFAETKTIDK